MSLRAEGGSKVSGMKIPLTSFAMSAWALRRLDWMAGVARSGSSANKVGTGPFRMSDEKQSAFKSQALSLMTGRLSLKQKATLQCDKDLVQTI